MYAALMHLTIDPALAPAAAAAFTGEILPKIAGRTGVHRRIWVDPVDRQGFGLLLFETEKQALGATPPAVVVGTRCDDPGDGRSARGTSS